MTIWQIFLIVVNFIGALGVFLFGMKLMSEGLQKVAGNKMRHILGRITGNPVSGIFTGMLVTSAIQSSSATTVMVVGFVNAGLLTLGGAIAVIMGANIGTTLTAWIIYLFGLGEGGGLFRLPMMCGAIALVLTYLTKSGKAKSVGEFVMGLALLLVGMDLLKAAMPDLTQYPSFLEGLGRLGSHGYGSVLLLVLVGTALTCVMQSSSAMMAITIVLCYSGWISFEMALPLVMGENIGTTITANLAAMVSNATGKKAARAHLLFNVVGVALVLMFFYPITRLVGSMATALLADPHLLPTEEGYDPNAIPLSLCLFHTLFNVANTSLQAWFIPWIEKVVNLMVKADKEEDEEQFRLKYIEGGMMNTAELNMQAAQQEIEDFSKRMLRMYTFLPPLREAQTEEDFEAQFGRIAKYEDIADRMELEIATFLTKVSEGGLSEEGSRRISAMLRIVDNLESIGDSIYQLAMLRKTKREQAVHFDQGLNDNLAQMHTLVQSALMVMDANLHTDYTAIDLYAAEQAEAQVNRYRDHLRAAHLEALKLGVYDYAIGSAYSGLFALYEKLADFAINVSEAMGKHGEEA